MTTWMKTQEAKNQTRSQGLSSSIFRAELGLGLKGVSWRYIRMKLVDISNKPHISLYH